MTGTNTRFRRKVFDSVTLCDVFLFIRIRVAEEHKHVISKQIHAGVRVKLCHGTIEHYREINHLKKQRRHKITTHTKRQNDIVAQLLKYYSRQNLIK